MSERLQFGVWCEIVCEVCARTIAGEWSYGRIPRKAMRDEATKAGWVRIIDDWRCPSCAKKGAPDGNA